MFPFLLCVRVFVCARHVVCLLVRVRVHACVSMLVSELRKGGSRWLKGFF